MGTDLGSVAASGPRRRGALSYAVSDGGPFTVSSAGELLTAGSLNAETSPSYTLTVTAINAHGLERASNR